jgi:sialate O-acetylesterase
MKTRLTFLTVTASLIAAFTGASDSTALAETRLPNVFGSHMVLQRDQDLPVWGWDEAGTEVTVRLGDSSVSTKAGKDGRWSVTLPQQSAGGPVAMTVSGSSTVELSDILIGEVWVCSGQSNMEWSVTRATNGKEEIAAAKFPKIRLFHVPRLAAGLPQDDVSAAWKACSPENVPNFSAVGYFFGRHLHNELDVPIGLINTSWGGTRIEPWTPPEGFAQVDAVTGIGDTILQRRKDVAAAEAAAKAAGKPVPKNPLANRGQPTGLYNGMVHGLAPFGIRGAIWYQGEANRLDGALYEQKMHALIKGWRKVWGQGDFPFLYVQLAPYIYREPDPEMLPRIWEAQAAVLKLKNTGMAVTTDIATIKNIHPPNKQDVGKRLALWALSKTYGQSKLVYSGPLYRSQKIDRNGIWLEFDHAAGGLKSRDGKPLSWFTIAGEDGEFFPAKAAIHGDKVHVTSDKVAKPKSVRFGWNQSAEPNLVNNDNLPASPFRTGK